MRNFRNYEVWQLGMQLTHLVYKKVQLPDNEKFGLTSQIRRATVSIPSNVAEGCSRKSDKEFVRFLEIALGSAFELETQLLICTQTELIKKEEDIKDVFVILNQVQTKLNALRSTIKASL